MHTVTLTRFQFTTTSPHKPGETFTSTALFCSRAWFKSRLVAWNRLGYTYTESAADFAVNASAIPAKFSLSLTPFGDDIKSAYIEERVGIEGCIDGFSYAMPPEAAARWASAYKVSIDDLSRARVSRLAA